MTEDGGPVIRLTAAQLLEQLHRAGQPGDRPTAPDRAALAAIDATAADLEAADCVELVRAYYADRDRANRTPRPVLYLHVGYLIGLLNRTLQAGAQKGAHGDRESS